MWSSQHCGCGTVEPCTRSWQCKPDGYIRMELSRRQTGKHPLRWPTDPMCFFDSQKAGAREQNAASDCAAPALSPLLSKTSL